MLSKADIISGPATQRVLRSGPCHSRGTLRPGTACTQQEGDFSMALRADRRNSLRPFRPRSEVDEGGAFQFLDPLAGRLGGRSRRQRSVHQRVSKPHRASSMARAQNWPVRWTAHAPSLQPRIHRSTARPALARLRTPIVPPLLLLLQMDHPAGPPFPRLQRPSCSSSPKRPCFHPWR